MAPLKLIPGIYVPTPTFFKEDANQSLDIAAHQEHILWLAKAGVQGVLIQGSTAEAVALTRDERNQLTKATREIVDQNGFKDFIIMAGAGAQSVLEAVELATDAKQYGADQVVVLPPAYFASSLTTDAIVQYYTEVADKSPLPVIIYSYPAVSGGIEISSDTFLILGAHPNISAVKQTDNSVGKMARNAFLNKQKGHDFLILGGGSDYLLGALAVGAHGTITGIANVAPKLVLKLVKLWEEKKLDEAMELQGQLSASEWAMLTGGVPGIKMTTHLFTGRGSPLPRRPIPPPPEHLINKMKTEVAVLHQMELALWKETGAQ